MMTLNYASLFIAAGCICLVNAIFVLFSWRGGKQYEGMRQLRIGLMLSGFFFLWQITRPWLPETLIVSFSQPAAVVGLTYIYHGFSLLTGRGSFLNKAAPVIVIALAALAYFLFRSPQTTMRAFIMASWMSTLAFLFIFHMLSLPGTRCRRLTRGILIVAVTFFGIGMSALDYYYLFVFGLDNQLDFLSPPPALGAGGLAALLSMSLYGMMALQLVSERAQADLDAVQARLVDELDRERELAATQRAFVAMASHQFRNPLAAIDISAHAIHRRAADWGREAGGRVAESAARIRQTVARMVSLMETMLGAATADEGKIALKTAPLDLAALIVEMVERIREIATDRVFDLDLTQLPAAIDADRDMIEQVVANVIGNAVKYSPKDQPIHIVGRVEGKDAVVAVADHGPGIPPEDQARIFERFYRGGNVRGHSGTGIGLTLTRYIVERHGGRITVDSTPGQGATFIIRLPIRRLAPDAG